MNEFEFGGVKYRSRPLDGEVQIAILRRLLPSAIAFAGQVGNLAAVYGAVLRWRTMGAPMPLMPDGSPLAVADGTETEPDLGRDFFQLVERSALSLEPMAEKLAKLDDADVAFITNACMGVTYRVEGSDGKPVRTAQGTVRNADDGKMVARLAIAWNVIRNDLGATLIAFMGDMLPDHAEDPPT